MKKIILTSAIILASGLLVSSGITLSHQTINKPAVIAISNTHQNHQEIGIAD